MLLALWLGFGPYGSVVLGQAGDRPSSLLPNLNMILPLVMVAFLLVVGPTAYLFRGLFTAAGDYLSSLVSLSLRLFPYEQPGARLARFYIGWRLVRWMGYWC